MIFDSYSSNSPESRGPAKRRTNSEDIKQRMQLLEDSMTKQKWTRDVDKPIDKVFILPIFYFCYCSKNLECFTTEK